MATRRDIGTPDVSSLPLDRAALTDQLDPPGIAYVGMPPGAVASSQDCARPWLHAATEPSVSMEALLWEDSKETEFRFDPDDPDQVETEIIPDRLVLLAHIREHLMYATPSRAPVLSEDDMPTFSPRQPHGGRVPHHQSICLVEEDEAGDISQPTYSTSG